MREREILNVFASRFGGHVYAKPIGGVGWAQTYEWQGSANALRRFLPEVGPFLIAKRNQADVVNVLLESRGTGRYFRGQGMDDEEFARQNAAYERMRELNRRGVPKTEVLR